MSHNRKKLGRRSKKDRRWSDWDIYRAEAERLGIDESEFFTSSDVATAMAATNEKIKYNQRKRGDLYVNGATIARYQWQGGHTDEQIAAIINVKAAEGVVMSVADVVKEKTWEQLDMDAHNLNEELKAQGVTDSYERAKIIGKQIYHSPD